MLNLFTVARARQLMEQFPFHNIFQSAWLTFYLHVQFYLFAVAARREN